MGIDYMTKNLVSPDVNIGLILQDMSEALKRADSIIMGLLDFSVPRALDLQSESLTELIDQTLNLVRHEMSNFPITLVRQMQDHLPPVLLDRNKVKQVFVNILTNAIHAMPDGGTLTIRTFRRKVEQEDLDNNMGSRQADALHLGQTLVVAEVLDTGQGIPADKLTHIFDPFFTTKPTGKGTGLGLTVTKKIVELHGGSIDIRNRPEGGVTVTIKFKA
jgi:signal transduction histidine kinase